MGKMELNVLWRIAEPAQVPSAPFFPQRSRFMLLGIAAGLALGVGLGFVLEQLDTSFGDVAELQAFTDVPVLSVVPTMRLKSRRRASKTPPAKEAPLIAPPPPLALEQYNILTTKVLSRLDDAGNGKVIMITSPAGGEGKTTTAINFALTLSTTVEGRVLLIDADLRRPRVQKYLGLKAECGFDDLLVDANPKLENCITTVGPLHILPGNRKIGNPVQTLASKRMQKILTELRRQYAYVVIDAPPILAMADSYILARLSDGQIVVIRACRTKSELFQHALESFYASNILGVVLNDVNLNKSRYANAYRYYQKNYGARIPA